MRDRHDYGLHRGLFPNLVTLYAISDFQASFDQWMLSDRLRLQRPTKFDGAKSSTCPTGPPKGAEWFHVKLTVSTATPAGEVKVYMKGALVTSWNPRYPIKNRGGVLVANGYKNVVYFKNFHIQ